MFSNKLQTNPSSRPRHRLPLTVALSATLAFASVPVAGMAQRTAWAEDIDTNVQADAAQQEVERTAAEYDQAISRIGDLNQQIADNEARIAEITRILGEATVVATPKRSNSVHIGSTVTVDMGGRERVFTIVGGAEADSHAGKISNESPVGAALLAHKKGDEIETTGPTGRVIKMKIVNIEH